MTARETVSDRGRLGLPRVMHESLWTRQANFLLLRVAPVTESKQNINDHRQQERQ